MTSQGFAAVASLKLPLPLVSESILWTSRPLWEIKGPKLTYRAPRAMFSRNEGLCVLVSDCLLVYCFSQHPFIHSAPVHSSAVQFGPNILAKSLLLQSDELLNNQDRQLHGAPDVTLTTFTRNHCLNMWELQ